jgi:carboxyl-terminal processing protease
VGRRSFGKGLVQEQYELSDGSGLRLTVARYFTPLGRSIQKSYGNGNEDYRKDIINRFKHGEMEYADSIQHKNQKQYTTQSGNTLYGGGGITPDIFVGYDTMAFDKEVMRSLIRGTLNQFAYLNYLQHQKQFLSYSSPTIFKEKYVVDDATLQNLKAFAEKDSVYLNLNNAEQKAQLTKQIKVLTARQIWRTEGFYEINNSYDETVRRALELISGIPISFTKKNPKK